MNKTKIEWCSHTWNPVTGCLHGCRYCYAREVAHRFGLTFAPKLGDPGMEGASKYDSPEGLDTMLELEKPYTCGGKVQPFPMAFLPTFHRYRLEEPEQAKRHRDVFVVSMGDLFGKWVPTSWIAQVIDACLRAPQHRYLFLTKNPDRYLELDHLTLLPHGENFWYGSTVANRDAAAMYLMQWANINTFWSMEPLLEPVPMEDAEGLPQWVILGAETGNRKDKVIPRREWVDQIAAFRWNGRGKSGTCACRLILPCKRHTRTRRAVGCGPSGTGRILHTTARRGAGAMQYIGQTKRGRRGCWWWRT